MKKTAHNVRWLKVCNGLLSGALALLGYASCDSSDEPAEEAHRMPSMKSRVRSRIGTRRLLSKAPASS